LSIDPRPSCFTILTLFVFFAAEYLARPLDLAHLEALRVLMKQEPSAMSTSLLMPDPNIIPDRDTWNSRPVEEWIADENLE